MFINTSSRNSDDMSMSRSESSSEETSYTSDGSQSSLSTLYDTQHRESSIPEKLNTPATAAAANRRWEDEEADVGLRSSEKDAYRYHAVGGSSSSSSPSANGRRGSASGSALDRRRFTCLRNCFIRLLAAHARLLIIVSIFICGFVLGVFHPSYLSVYTRRPETFDHRVSYLPSRLSPPPPSSSELDYFGLVNEAEQLVRSGRRKADVVGREDVAGAEKIPNIVHYVYGLKQSKGDSIEEFPYYAYLGMRSALISLRPEKIMFHCINEPQGYWWDQVKNWEGWIDETDRSSDEPNGRRKGLVEVVPARQFDTVGKSKRPVENYAHKADILRLEVLLKYGGIYLDIDMFVLKSFRDERLLMYDTVMGMEALDLNLFHGPRSDDEMAPKGLCNAVILAKKNSEFLRLWLDAYETFEDNWWTEHSVKLPWLLARLHPTMITVLSERALFWPLWSSDHIDAVYVKDEYSFEASGQLGYHLWESKAESYLTTLEPASVKEMDTSFKKMASKFQAPGEEERWNAHLAHVEKEKREREAAKSRAKARAAAHRQGS